MCSIALLKINHLATKLHVEDQLYYHSEYYVWIYIYIHFRSWKLYNKIKLWIKNCVLLLKMISLATKLHIDVHMYYH